MMENTGGGDEEVGGEPVAGSGVDMPLTVAEGGVGDLGVEPNVRPEVVGVGDVAVVAVDVACPQ